MNLLMISGDRSVLQGKQGAFWYTLEEFHKHWERVDVICPHASNQQPATSNQCVFGNVYFHPNPRSLCWQECWIRKKGLELIQGHKHDVMTVHDYPPFYNGAGAMFLGKKTGIPYALEVHHVVGCPKAASFAEFIGRIMSRFYFPWASKKATAIRCVDSGTSEKLKAWGVRPEKISIVPSFYLDSERLRPDTSVAKRYDVICCSRLVANKGIREVLQAIAALQDVSLLIVGDGPQRNALEALARRLGIAERTTFAGWLETQTDVYRAIQSGKIFIMNSKSEGGPRIALEAMALGMPVIATPVGLMPDVIEEGMNGILTIGDSRDLSRILRELLDDSGRRANLGQGAQKILERFDRTKLIRGYAEYLKLLAS